MDVSQHTLVPEHSLIDEEDLDEVLAEYNIKRTDLPKIKRTDPALPNEADVGDVIEIVRESRTADRAVIYRLVID
jgi:DNA-directed RNA polymerase subunit H